MIKTDYIGSWETASAMAVLNKRLIEESDEDRLAETLCRDIVRLGLFAFATKGRR